MHKMNDFFFQFLQLLARITYLCKKKYVSQHSLTVFGFTKKILRNYFQNAQYGKTFLFKTRHSPKKMFRQINTLVTSLVNCVFNKISAKKVGE